MKDKKLTPKQKTFADWLVTPKRLRGTIITQIDFAEVYSISVQTLCNWQKLPVFNDYLTELIEKILEQNSPEMIQEWQEFALDKLNSGEDHRPTKDYLDFVEKKKLSKKGVYEGGVTIIVNKKPEVLDDE